MQMHHGHDEDVIASKTIHNRVGETLEVQLAVLPSNPRPTLGSFNNQPQRDLELVQEIIPKPGLHPS
jgi:hypothetical protein